MSPSTTSELTKFEPLIDKTPRFTSLEDPIHDRMRANRYYGQVLQLRSIHGKASQAVNMEPTHVRGYDTRWLGVPKLSAAEQAKGLFPIAVPGETYVKAVDGFVVDCGTEEGLYLWEWLQFAPQLIQDDDKFDPAKPHEGADKEFYVVVPDWEEERQAKQYTDRIEAGNYIRSLSPTKWYNIARLIGSGMDNASQLAVYNYLLDVAEKRPKALLDLKDDSLFEVKLLVKRLLDHHIIKLSDGAYKYNQLFLGTTEEQVLGYVQLAQHQDIVTVMRNSLGVQGGNVPVTTQYASYRTESEAQIQKQAQSPSTVLTSLPNNNASATDTADGDELDDDYPDDEANSGTGDSGDASKGNAANTPAGGAAPAAKPKPTPPASRPPQRPATS